jgi:hypothetical protein
MISPVLTEREKRVRRGKGDAKTCLGEMLNISERF